MAVVSIFAASFCDGDEIAKQVADELGYRLVGDEVLEAAAKRLGTSAKKLDLLMRGRPSPLDKLLKNRERQVAAIRHALIESIRSNDVVYRGFAGHLVPRTIPHVLQVCILANRNHRLSVATDRDGLPAGKALRLIKRDDEDSVRWTEYLHGTHPWDKDLYDVKLPIHQSSVDEAVKTICELAKRPEVDQAPDFEGTLDDYELGAEIAAVLAKAGIRDAQVVVDRGYVVLQVEDDERLEAKLVKLVGGIEGVTEVVVEPPEPPPTEEVELGAVARKVLLVDDEEQYVHTLSQRLQLREFEPTIAMDGEQALASVGHGGTEVMVLDLHMPGIDGMDVLRQVKENSPDTEVIILTGYGSEEVKAKAFELGAFAFLEKPVGIDELTRTMSEAYAHVHARR